MREKIEAKRVQAQAEIESWSGRAEEAQRNLQRWIGVLSLCEELLAEEAPTVENSPEVEQSAK